MTESELKNAKEMLRKQAYAGDQICKAALAFEAEARMMGFGTMIDYGEDEYEY